MDSVFQKWVYIKKNIVDKVDDTWTTVLWSFGRKESHVIRGLPHFEFAEILLHQSKDELHERIGDGAGIRISSKHHGQGVNVLLKFFCL